MRDMVLPPLNTLDDPLPRNRKPALEETIGHVEPYSHFFSILKRLHSWAKEYLTSIRTDRKPEMNEGKFCGMVASLH